MLGPPSDYSYWEDVTPNSIRVERLGGFAGFGGSSHLRSEGEVDLDRLSPADRAVVEQLLLSSGEEAGGTGADRFRYRLTWTDRGQDHSIEVGEDQLPQSIRSAVKDRLV